MSKDHGADERLRVMVVDDHALFRRGLEMVLGNEPDLELVGEASDGQEAIDYLSGIGKPDLAPIFSAGCAERQVYKIHGLARWDWAVEV